MTTPPTPRIDNVSAGYAFAYDVKTGEVLWTHEKLVEVEAGQAGSANRITETECEQIRAEAARVFRRRDIDILPAPDGFVLRDNVRIVIDPKSKTLREIQDEPRSLADRFAELSK